MAVSRAMELVDSLFPLLRYLSAMGRLLKYGQKSGGPSRTLENVWAQTFRDYRQHQSEPKQCAGVQVDRWHQPASRSQEERKARKLRSKARPW